MRLIMGNGKRCRCYQSDANNVSNAESLIRCACSVNFIIKFVYFRKILVSVMQA